MGEGIVGVKVGMSVGVLEGTRVGGRVGVEIRNSSSTVMEQEERRTASSKMMIVFFIGRLKPYEVLFTGGKSNGLIIDSGTAHFFSFNIGDHQLKYHP